MRVVLFDIDSLRPDHLGCYGYPRPTSPNIDAIAREGTVFTRYYCADSPCMPSRHGLISGRYGINNGVVTHGGQASKLQIEEQLYGGPAPQNQLLQRRLRESGMETICFSNFAFRHSAAWFSLGWSEFHSPTLSSGDETADEVNDAVLRWIDSNADRDNWMLYVNYWDPHRIYHVDPSWAERFRGSPVPQSWPDEDAIRAHLGYPGAFTANHQFPNGRSTVPLMPGAVRSRRDFEQMVTGYDAEIAYADHHVGMVLEALAARDALDGTAIIVTADHGDNFGEHGIYSDHVCADEAIHHIPLVIKWPGVSKAGHRCESMLYNIDLSATLIDLAGGEIPDRYDGVSFRSGLTGVASPADDSTGEPSGTREHLVWGHGLYTLQRAVRTASHLFIRTYDDHGYRFDPVALYDMTSDPYQTRNLVADLPALANEMDAKLNDWLAQQSRKPYAIPDPFQTVLHERRRAVADRH